MSHHDRLANQTPEQALTTARIVWAALLLGVLTVTGIMIAMTLQSPPQPTGIDWFFIGLPAALLVMAAGIGHVVRQQVYKAGWVNHVVNPKAYVTGLIIYLAALEGVCVIAAIFMVIGAPMIPSLLIIGVGLALMAINFPNGKPMFPPDRDRRIGNFDA
ncbi:MAG: hypothetical protein AAF586_09765 [Planctomycetota bacterium]